MPRLLRQLLRARLGLSSVSRATAAPGGLQHSHTWRYGSLDIRVLDPLCSRTEEEEEDTEWNQEKRRAWIVSQEASACERFVSPSQECKKTIGLHLGSEGLGVHIKGRDEDDERRKQYHVAGGRRQRQQFLLTARELHTHTCLQTAMARSKIGRLPITMQQGARTHIGHAAHEHSHEADEKAGEAGERVLKLGLWGDILLTIGKGTAGYVSGSKAIIADAAHSLSDIVLSSVALWTSKAARAPKDKEHPYGHGKIETMGALTISSLLLVTGGGIAWHAIETIQAFVQTTVDSVKEHVQSLGHGHEHQGAGHHHHGIDMEHPEVALSAAVVSIGVKEGLFWVTKAVGEKQGSALLQANAWHHRSDAISSVVALIGVGGAVLGLPLLDPVAALIVSGMIIKAGLESGYQSLQELMDRGLPESVLGPVRQSVLEVQGVEGVHELRGRRMGSTIHLDVHIEVDPWLSVSAAHNIGNAVRQQVHKRHPNVTESFIHIGSKSDLLQPSDSISRQREQHIFREEFDSLQQSQVEQVVRSVLDANFKETVGVRHVTCHFLQGKVVVELGVTLDNKLAIRDAMEHAKDVERVLLKNVPDITTVQVQLSLSQ
ncbi:unnamed protein product [Sphagnum troendelagicum]|uniref:Cation efflux protein cytoplasmic domain-containing protein n=1 Tax=Sphagnum troendelagicum TaxID=128251 RepID=A0ABP0TGI5_9BRYO